MNTEIKWAEVAHYYKELPILVDGSCERTAVFFWPSGKCHSVVRFYSESGKETGASHENLSVVEYAPILRALEDITQQDADEYLHRFTTYQNFIGKPSAVTLALESINHRLWKIYEAAAVIYWLISKGFDVFGLIASGQAIRKSIG